MLMRISENSFSVVPYNEDRSHPRYIQWVSHLLEANRRIKGLEDNSLIVRMRNINLCLRQRDIDAWKSSFSILVDFTFNNIYVTYYKDTK